jgi:proline iminopeptidase
MIRQPYPEIQPYYQGKLPVSPLHTLYFEESGNPQGKPVIFLHGGPGGGSISIYRQMFDPLRYRIILYDQRGCGRSTPPAELTDNTTPHLIQDIETLRQHLNIEKWMVYGGSWGSTLALAYAQIHPDRCTELILRGIFLLRQSEIQWFYQSGASHLFPDAWEKYLAPIPDDERHDLVSAYHRRLTSDNPQERAVAAAAWSVWEGSTSKLMVDAELRGRFSQASFADAFARIECHYFVNRGFFETDDQLLQNIDRIRHIPTVIVQGRYDVVCPMRSAWDLHRAFPEAQFIVIPDAGHSMTEPGILTALLDASDRFAGA